MDIKKAVSWLNSRFKTAKESKYSSFKVTDFDFKAFLTLVGYIDILHKEKVSENTLFAKMYIYHLNQMIDTYKTNVLEDIPQKELSKILDLPLDTFYDAFHNKLKSAWHDDICKSLIGGEDVTKKYVKEKYSIEFVTDQLDFMINQALNKFE